MCLCAHISDCVWVCYAAPDRRRGEERKCCFCFFLLGFLPRGRAGLPRTLASPFWDPMGCFFDVVYAAPCRALTCLSAPVWKMSRVRFYLQILSAVGSGCSGAGGKISGRKKKSMCVSVPFFWGGCIHSTPPVPTLVCD